MSFTIKEITDVETLRAIAHPLRMKLLGLLRREGPATASTLGRRLGESSGSTSYHLRQLERFGFVVEDEVQPSARERRWKAAHEMTSFPDQLWDSEEGRELFDDVRSRQFEHLRDGLAAWTGPRTGIGHNDYMLHLDPADLTSLEADIEALVARYAGRSGSESVALHVLALPAGES